MSRGKIIYHNSYILYFAANLANAHIGWFIIELGLAYSRLLQCIFRFTHWLISHVWVSCVLLDNIMLKNVPWDVFLIDGWIDWFIDWAAPGITREDLKKRCCFQLCDEIEFPIYIRQVSTIVSTLIYIHYAYYNMYRFCSCIIQGTFILPLS